MNPKMSVNIEKLDVAIIKYLHQNLEDRNANNSGSQEAINAFQEFQWALSAAIKDILSHIPITDYPELSWALLVDMGMLIAALPRQWVTVWVSIKVENILRVIQEIFPERT